MNRKHLNSVHLQKPIKKHFDGILKYGRNSVQNKNSNKCRIKNERVMFEYIDDRLGKVKLINVTEARANFSRLLSDMDSYYVITKNNRPQRVVINYDEFQELKTQFEAQQNQIVKSSTEKNEQKVLSKSLSSSTAEEKSSNNVSKKSESRVKGLLAKQFEMAHAQTPESEEEQSFEGENLQSENPSSLKMDSGDYFAIGEAEEDNFELPSPDDVFSDEEDSSQDFASHLIDDLESELTLPEDDFSSKEDSQKETATKNSQTYAAELDHKNEDDDFAKQSLTPEEQNYYDKYRKLYESFEPQAPEDVAVSQNSEDFSDDLENVDSLVESLPQLDEDKNDENNNSAQEVQFANSQEVFEEKSERKVDPSLQTETLDSLLKTEDEASNQLPSLQELLRGLGSAAEETEEDLSDQEIDNIVKRIRHEE